MVLQPANGCNSNLESKGQILIPLKLNRIMVQEKDTLMSGKEKFHQLSKIHLCTHISIVLRGTVLSRCFLGLFLIKVFYGRLPFI